MVESIPQKMTWHDVDQQAMGIAGNSALVRRVPEVYKRYPGLNIKIMERLKYYDFAANASRLGATVFNMNKGQVATALNQLIQSAHIRDTPEKQEALNRQKEKLFGALDTGNAQYTSFTSAYFSQGMGGKTQRHVWGVASDFADLSTRQEILGTLAQVNPSIIKSDVKSDLAELHAFVRVHEFQHGRTYQTWALNKDLLDSAKVSDLEQDKPEYKIFKQKAVQAKGLDDEYFQYLNETLSDTVAALHHLKNGGSADLIQEVADARAYGFVNHSTPRYATFSVLDEMTKNEAELRAIIQNTPEENLDDLGVYIVARAGWGRDEFYANAMASQMVIPEIRRKMGDDEKTLAQRYAQGNANVRKTLEQGYPDEPVKQRQLLSFSATKLPALVDRTQSATFNLRHPNNALTYHEHLIEVQAAVKYSQIMHPEFNTPAGATHLLAIRQRRHFLFSRP